MLRLFKGVCLAVMVTFPRAKECYLAPDIGEHALPARQASTQFDGWLSCQRWLIQVVT